jgi:hypothetical protein
MRRWLRPNGGEGDLSRQEKINKDSYEITGRQSKRREETKEDLDEYG